MRGSRLLASYLSEASATLVGVNDSVRETPALELSDVLVGSVEFMPAKSLLEPARATL